MFAYHATNKKFDKFDINKLGRQSDHPSAYFGFYFFSDKKAAQEHAKDICGFVKKYYLNIKNPFIMQAIDFEEELDFWRGIKNTKYGKEDYFKSKYHFEDNAIYLKQNGFDGVIIKGGETKYPELDYNNYVVFDSEQIKKVK